MRIVIVTNMPAPYRIETWNITGNRLGNNFLVIFCSKREPNRNWDTAALNFNHIFLRENFKTSPNQQNFIHNNPDVWKELKRFKPDVVITGGFNPTMLYAFFYTVLYRKKHIPMSDAWEKSEQHLSLAHVLIRKIVYKLSHAFISCSIKGKAYFESFGITSRKIFISHLSIEQEKFRNTRGFQERDYDIMFSGQLIERKNPFFFLEVAQLLKARIPHLKILILGDGPLLPSIRSKAQEGKLDIHAPGNIAQEELGKYYSNSRIFLFPTQFDAWGVVANESLASGTPVITTENAGCAGELVLPDMNGYVLPLNAETWAYTCLNLLQDEACWKKFSDNAVSKAADFTPNHAANAIVNAATLK